ncbi:MAG: DUF72 domain-containing protein, partial [Myxococcota bacterium]
MTRAQLGLFGQRDEPAAAPGIESAPYDDELATFAARLPTSLRCGTSSWSFPGWAGLVYDRHHDERRLAREGLAAYARHPLLRAVGIDRTHYAPVGVAQYQQWACAVPEDFRFLVKA